MAEIHRFVARPMPGATRFLPAKPSNRSEWESWKPEQLWLWPDLFNPAVHACMDEVVSQAVDALDPAIIDPRGLKLLSILHASKQFASALRLCSHLIRGPMSHATHRGIDLSACCLLLAMLRFNDALAAVEFNALAHRHAMTVCDSAVPGARPAPLTSVGSLQRRCTRQARKVMMHRFSLPSPDQIMATLARAAAKDPLAYYLGYALWSDSLRQSVATP